MNSFRFGMFLGAMLLIGFFLGFFLRENFFSFGINRIQIENLSAMVGTSLGSSGIGGGSGSCSR